MGRSESLLSGGKEKTSREGGKGKRRVDLVFSLAPGDFLIDFQGYVSNLFFRNQGLVNGNARQYFWNNFPKFNLVWHVCIRSHWSPFMLSFFHPPPHTFTLPSFSPLPLLQREKEVTSTSQNRTYFQIGCLHWQHRSPTTIKTFALPERLFSFGLYMRLNESKVLV